MTVKVMFSLPDQLVNRMKAAIPSKERSRVAAALFEREINIREEALYHCAKELEENKSLRDEMISWDSAFSEDGLYLFMK